MQETIGTRLQTAIGIRNLTQMEVAAAADISVSYVSMIINGSKNPSKKLIARLCSILNISREWLLTGNGSMEEETDSVSDIAMITSELLNSDPVSLKRVFAMTIAMLSEEQLSTIDECISIYNKQKRKATG